MLRQSQGNGEAGGSQSASQLKCTSSAHSWVTDIENRTRGNWDDYGRVELAKQYAIESAYDYIAHSANKHKKNDRKVVKDAFLEIF